MHNQPLSQFDEVEILVGDDGGHPGAALGTWNDHPVYYRCINARICREYISDLHRRHVLAFPAECVTGSVYKVKIAFPVLPHQIACSVPAVAVREDIAQHLALGCFGIRVPLKAAHRVSVFINLANGFAGLVNRTSHAEALFAAGGLTGIRIEPDQRHRITMCEKRRDTADRADLALAIIERKVCLSSGIEFQDLWDAEAPLKLLPYVRPQPIAAAKPDTMPPFPWMRRRIDEVSAELANILENRALPLRDLVPEAARRKLLPEHDRSAAHQHRPSRHHAANAMIHRQAIVHPIRWTRVHHAREPMAPLHQSKVTDICRLRQS